MPETKKKKAPPSLEVVNESLKTNVILLQHCDQAIKRMMRKEMEIIFSHWNWHHTCVIITTHAVSNQIYLQSTNKLFITNN